MKKYTEMPNLLNLELQKEVLIALADEDKIKFSETIDSIHKRNLKAKIIYLNTWFNKSIAAAVAIAIIVGGSVFTYNYVSNQTVNGIYTTNFISDINLVDLRGNDILMSEAVLKGISNYRNGNFKLAIELFKVKNDDIVGNLYSGFCYMQLEQFEKAITHFKFIISNNSNLLIDQAEWNLGLCYLKTGKNDLAKSMFEKIVKEKEAYSIKAEKILLKL